MQSFIVAERAMSESGRVHVVEDRVEHHTQHHFLVDRQTDGNARVWKPALQQQHECAALVKSLSSALVEFTAELEKLNEPSVA